MAIDLTLVWISLLATAVFLYVVMDGFDLGIGILFAFIREKHFRDVMVNSVAPFWDGNETWLVLGGGGLMAAFPLAYAIIMPALYMPVILMLLSLVFRGVSFEMRFKAGTARSRRLWDSFFTGGSYGAALCQGIIVGALEQGVKVHERAYAGGWWDWLSPFTLFTGIAVVIGYALLGACWLVWKTENTLQHRVSKIAYPFAILTLISIVLVSLIMPFLNTAFLARWFTFPNLLYASPVPVFVMILAYCLFRSLRHIQEKQASPGDEQEKRKMWTDCSPFFYTLGLFLLSFIGLGISMWPMIVPPDISLTQAAASHSSQYFLLLGAIVLIPVILLYTAYVYWLFRGKIYSDSGYHS